MKKIIEKHREEFIRHALEEFPKEACGVVATKGKRTKYIPCINKHPLPTEDFECTVETADIEDDGYSIVAVFHSHTNGNPTLTQADLTGMNASKTPYILLCLPQEEFVYQSPTEEEIPYKGRFYMSGVQDCYTLVRDYYKREFGIALKDFYRNEKWWDNGLNVLNEENFKAAGFYSVPVEDVQVGDVFVMQFGKVNDHLAIYVGNSKILHHCYNRLSCEDVYGGMWQKHTTSIQRYKHE